MTDLNWNKIKNYLKNNWDTSMYNTWIKNMNEYKIIGNTIYVTSIFDDFTERLFKDNYLSRVENIAKNNFNKDIKIIYVSDEEDFNQLVHSNINDINTDNNYNKNQSDDKNSKLIEKYTFDNFVVGNSNRFANAASIAVAESPAKAYNPLFLYGGVGLGKTHLMHAIGHFIKDKNNDAKVVYITSETFTNDLINSIQNDKNMEFRSKYRNVDVLLIDDIQFIAGKERTQEEFFHTFNTLHEANKQIIISSDRPPNEIPTLEDRLKSRFAWGLIADIQAPDYETRIAILRKKAIEDNLSLSNDIYEYIAKNIKSNIRELEGALTRVTAFCSLINVEPSVESAKEALKNIIKNNEPKNITIKYIKNVVSNFYNIKPKELESQSRQKKITNIRQIAIYLCRELTDEPLAKIGENFGGRDHTTIMHTCSKISKIIEDNKDPEMKHTIDQLMKTINND